MKTSKNDNNQINDNVNNINSLKKNSTIEIITTDRKRNEINNEKNLNKGYRKDAFGNIISKNYKSYHISFIDEISNKPLLEICSLERNDPIIIFENKTSSKCQSCNIF